MEQLVILKREDGKVQSLTVSFFQEPDGQIWLEGTFYLSGFDLNKVGLLLKNIRETLGQTVGKSVAIEALHDVVELVLQNSREINKQTGYVLFREKRKVVRDIDDFLLPHKRDDTPLSGRDHNGCESCQ
jgi:hypothetical protein